MRTSTRHVLSLTLAVAFAAVVLPQVWPSAVNAAGKVGFDNAVTPVSRNVVPVACCDQVSFKLDVKPVIQIRCLRCHQPGGEGYEKSGLDMRTYESLMKGTKFGPVVVPSDAFTSNLMVLIEGRAKIKMPMQEKDVVARMTSCDKDIFRRWINQGAKNN